jgi:hypothetical protein
MGRVTVLFDGRTASAVLQDSECDMRIASVLRAIPPVVVCDVALSLTVLAVVNVRIFQVTEALA